MKYFLIIIALLVAHSAHALQVGNCDDKAHTLQLDYYGEVMEFTLQPNQHRYFFGRARELSLGEQNIYLIHYNNEYCIYDGRIKLQRRGRNIGKAY